MASGAARIMDDVAGPEAGPAIAKSRLPGLDILRLLAALLVLGRHMWPADGAIGGPLLSVYDGWRRGGWVGVDLFFVLSGFLVSGLLFNQFKTDGNLSIGRFYLRRAWKIYPPFFLMIAVTIVVQAITDDARLSSRRIINEVLFIQNYSGGLWYHTWSLGVEEHFYLLLPLVLLVVRRSRDRSAPFGAVLWLGLAIAVACLGLRLLNLRGEEFRNRYLFATHFRLDSLFFGVLISHLYHSHTQAFVARFKPWRWALIAASVPLLAPAFMFPVEKSPFIWTGGLTLFYLGSGMLLVGVLLCRAPRYRFALALASIGASSYSIYLWHMPVCNWIMPRLDRLNGGPLPFAVKTVLYPVIVVTLGVAMAKLVEMPCLRLRERLFPPRARVKPAALADATSVSV